MHHNLNVMHIEKNKCDTIVGTLLSIDGKSKDNMNILTCKLWVLEINFTL